MAQLVDHQVSLQFMLPDEVNTLKLQDEVFDAIHELPGWIRIDDYDVEIPRFELYQTDFDSIVHEGSDVTLWILTFGSSKEISQDEMREVCELLRGVVERSDARLKYLYSSEYRKYEYSTTTRLSF